MNKHRIGLMIKMLEEVQAGTWKGIRLKPSDIKEFDPVRSGILKDATETFNLSSWTVKNTKSPCGYTACAVGHAGLDKRFRKLGLKINWEGIPEFNGEDSFEAVTEFFDLEEDVIHILYVDAHYPDDFSSDKILTQVIRRHKLLLEIGEGKFMEKLRYFSSDRLISPQGRVYNRKL